MSSTASNTIATNTIDTITATSMAVGNSQATNVILGNGSSTVTRATTQLVVQTGATTSPTQYVSITAGATPQISISGTVGTAGQVLTSGGASAINWATPVAFASGAITTIANQVLTAYVFPTPIEKTASPNAPLILLTGENGGANLLVQLSVGIISGNATQWTGFSYITSGSGLTKISWIAINQ